MVKRKIIGEKGRLSWEWIGGSVQSDIRGEGD